MKTQETKQRSGGLIEYMLSLDYDNVQFAYMVSEQMRLKRMFPQFAFVLFKSSRVSYHLRVATPMDWKLG